MSGSNDQFLHIKIKPGTSKPIVCCRSAIYDEHMINTTPLLIKKASLLLYAAALSLGLAGIPVHAAVLADFSGGTGTSTPDQFQGAAGGGWSAGWLKQNGSNTTVSTAGTTTFSVIGASDVGYTPLNNGGNYLQVDYSRTSTGGTIRAGVARQFDSSGPGSMDLTNPYEIHFDFRLDTLTGFSSSADQIVFSTEDTTTISSSQAAAPWYLWIRGDEGFSVQNGNGTGGASRVNLTTKLGLTVQTGVVYSVAVYLNPETFSYDITIFDGTTIYRASQANGGNLLGFRTNTLAKDANVFQGRMVNDGAGDHIAVSLDNISIIPEPNSLALLGGALGALSILRYFTKPASSWSAFR